MNSSDTVTCLECSAEFRQLNNFHLKKHGLTVDAYLTRHPGSPLFSEASRKSISEGTKRGMRDPEAWKKFTDYIENRDISGEKHPRFGKHHSEETKRKISENKERAKKISAGKKRWWDAGRIGKTVEELYGEETGRRVRALKREQTAGERNPAFGKVYENCGWKVGRYKGYLFRSIFEYSFYRHLEAHGELGKLQYEPFSIPYQINGRRRTYTPDFLVEKTLYEVKPSYVTEELNEVFRSKNIAAREYCRENGLEFRVVTEKDFEILPYKEAYADPDVVWIRK